MSYQARGRDKMFNLNPIRPKNKIKCCIFYSMMSPQQLMCTEEQRRVTPNVCKNCGQNPNNSSKQKKTGEKIG